MIEFGELVIKREAFGVLTDLPFPAGADRINQLRSRINNGDIVLQAQGQRFGRIFVQKGVIGIAITIGFKAEYQFPDIAFPDWPPPPIWKQASGAE